MGTTGVRALDRAAREAVSSACAVHDATDGDRVDGVEPALVAQPSSTSEVSELLRATAAHGLRVVPRGRGTKLTWGNPPSGVDVVVDLAAMDRVVEHAAGDLIAILQAGAPLEEVQRTLAAGGQQLAVDEMVAGASVGGAVAANTSGPRRMLAGTLRDLMIGITVVRADGVVAKAGGRVVKNVAGYDLGKLMIGSLGTLAVATEAVFRLHPLPEARRWVTVPVDGPEQAHRISQSVVHAQVVPSAVEVDLPAAGRGAVQVLLEGRADGVAARTGTVRGLLGAGGGEPEERSDAPAGWASYPWSRGTTGLKLTCVLSGLQDVLSAAREVGADVRGSAGTGVLYASIEQADHVPDALRRLREACHGHGGSAVVVDAPPEVKQAVDVWGPVPALDLMRSVKERFDPDHRLSPGRFVGGI